jgi:hypothetical protein
MKVKTLSALAGLGGVMIASSANAAFTGMSLVSSDAFFASHPNAAVQAAWNAPGGNNLYDIYRLYANFDSNTAADRVNAFAGTPTAPFTVSVVGGTFYNYTDAHLNHFNLPGVSPNERAWDTMVTINALPSGGATILSPGFAAETNNLGASTNLIPASTNVAWVIEPGDAAGQAVATAAGQAAAPAGVFRVLVAQFTVTSGGLIVGTGSLNVNGADQLVTFTNVPAPGALALLGLAGLVCRRRRA